MKVHPAPRKRTTSTTTTQYGVDSSNTPNPKKLRRLPHVFAKVLELPFHSEANVSVEETSESFCFTAAATEHIMHDEVKAHAVEIFPGLTKVVIRGTDGVDFCDDSHELEVAYLNLWRFRLPASTRPEMASARCTRGQLIVTVPKEEISRKVDDHEDDDNDHQDHDDGIWIEETIERIIIVE